MQNRDKVHEQPNFRNKTAINREKTSIFQHKKKKWAKQGNNN